LLGTAHFFGIAVVTVFVALGFPSEENGHCLLQILDPLHLGPSFKNIQPGTIVLAVDGKLIHTRREAAVTLQQGAHVVEFVSPGEQTLVRTRVESANVSDEIWNAAIRTIPYIEVYQTEPQKAAANAGLKPGYILLLLNGQPFATGLELIPSLSAGNKTVRITALKPGPALFNAEVSTQADSIGLTLAIWPSRDQNPSASWRGKVIRVAAESLRSGWRSWLGGAPLDFDIPGNHGLALVLNIALAVMVTSPFFLLTNAAGVNVLTGLGMILTLSRPHFFWYGLAFIVVAFLQRRSELSTRILTGMVVIWIFHLAPMGMGMFSGIALAAAKLNHASVLAYL
jgi:hypothetical protein